MIVAKRKFITLGLISGVSLFMTYNIVSFFSNSSTEDPEMTFNRVVVKSPEFANEENHDLKAKSSKSSIYSQLLKVQFPHKIVPLKPINWFTRIKDLVRDRDPSSDIKSSDYPRILLYESFRWWGITEEVLNCPNSEWLKCQLSDEINSIDEADVLISAKDGFHHTDMTFFHKYLVGKKLIYYTLESPLVTLDFSITNPEMEMFASYWRKSDFWVPYSNWVPNTNNSDGSLLKSKENKQTGKNYAEGKTRLASIVVSNCQTANNRLSYVKELQQFMTVDVYGKCGNYACGSDTDACFEALKMEYKFYLSFENSNCVDYITEKFFRNALKYEMVPIVMGARKEDYASLAPYKSFIHIEDFNSPEELAKYLLILDNKDSLYNEYFQWKTMGSYQPVNFMCQVCAMLYESKYANNETTEISSRLPFGFQWGFHNNEKLCLPLGEWYWEKKTE